jgi:hypothetical protein
MVNSASIPPGSKGSIAAQQLRLDAGKLQRLLVAADQRRSNGRANRDSSN